MHFHLYLWLARGSIPPAPHFISLPRVLNVLHEPQSVSFLLFLKEESFINAPFLLSLVLGEYKELMLVFIATSQANNHCEAGRAVMRLSANTGLKRKSGFFLRIKGLSYPSPLTPKCWDHCGGWYRNERYYRRVIVLPGEWKNCLSFSFFFLSLKLPGWSG